MSPRRLSDDEHVLWKGVTRSIAPLRKALKLEADPLAAPAAKAAPKPRVRSAPAKAAPVAAAPVAAPKTPPLVPLGRKMKQRIARGANSIDGRLDLHGMTQDEAHGALFRFLRARQARGCKLILVITGKGARGGEGRGVLKRMVPLWLGLPECRGLVIGFEDAAIGHGGEGALYVRLRRARD